MMLLEPRAEIGTRFEEGWFHRGVGCSISGPPHQVQSFESYPGAVDDSSTFVRAVRAVRHATATGTAGATGACTRDPSGHSADEYDPPGVRRRHARLQRPTRSELLAALAGLYDLRATRAGDLDADRA